MKLVEYLQHNEDLFIKTPTVLRFDLPYFHSPIVTEEGQ